MAGKGKPGRKKGGRNRQGCRTPDCLPNDCLLRCQGVAKSLREYVACSAQCTGPAARPPAVPLPAGSVAAPTPRG